MGINVETMSDFSDHFPADFGGVHVPEQLQEWVNAELMDDETIQWIDQPIPYFFSKDAISIVLFAIPWTAFSVFGMCGAVGVFDWNGGGFNLQNFDIERSLTAVFLLPFVLIGLWLLSAPLRVYRHTKRSVYVITDHRAMIVQGTFSAHNVTSYYPADYWTLTRTQKANGTGSLCFYIEKDNDSFQQHGFRDIRNVKEVERILQKLKETQ